jgi:hypothetical protein
MNKLEKYLHLAKMYKSYEITIDDLQEEQVNIVNDLDKLWNQLTEFERNFLRGVDND